MDKLFLYSKRFLFIFLFILFVILFMDFNARVSNLFRKNVQRSGIQTEIHRYKLTEIALHTQIAYATSEVSVEQWAREEAHLAQPGDVPVIIIPAAGIATPTPAALPTPAPKPVANWEVWQVLLFGE